MIGIVIVAHGGLAREYLSAMEHILGPQSGIVPVAIAAEDSREGKIAEIIAAANRVDEGDGVVVVTDMFGGSPSNLSMPACMQDKRKIMAGANLPMLIKLAKLRGQPVALAVESALAAGKKYINSFDGAPFDDHAHAATNAADPRNH
ncbi:PTS sugar transporter subunit IIA [Mangrovicoccus algicola]|uniref:PTS fructose transporter subunit IIA n=1 Tax=Mangrovicoccus algicola TaxID=2771008 RepID=A0A8J7CVN5_9RHOB|nr:PTS fructose transporter subunit IIA [Mangrovicoccus algicola]MBE3638939.1 PTS fructose transporter subunit IIA [Mangrovicoccus algicola]